MRRPKPANERASGSRTPSRNDEDHHQKNGEAEAVRAAAPAPAHDLSGVAETTEKISHGDGHVGVWLPAPPGLQEALIEEAPRVVLTSVQDPVARGTLASPASAKTIG